MMNYSEAVISGTYGFTTIVLTVFSIISTYIKVNVFPVELVKMRRYSLLSIFLPIVIHTFYLAAITRCEILGEFVFTLLESFILIFYIFIHSYLILEIYYFPDALKESIKRTRKKTFFKKIRKSSLEKIIIELKQEKEEFDKFFKNKRKNDENIYNKDDAKSYFSDLLQEIIKIPAMDEESLLNCMDTLDDYIKIDDKSIDNYQLQEITKIKYLLYFTMQGNTNLDLYKSIFNRLYMIYENNKNINSMNQKNSLEEVSELSYQFNLMTWCDSLKIKYLIDTLFDNKWNIKDSVYLSIFYRIIINNSSLIKMNLDKETEDKIEYIINTYKDIKNIDIEKYGKNYNDVLKQIIKYIKKEI